MTTPLPYTAGTDRHAVTVTNHGLTYCVDGRQWSVDGPLFVLHYYDRQHPRPDVCPVPYNESFSLGTPGTVSQSAKSAFAVEPRDDGAVCIALTFDNIDIRIRVVLRLDDDGAGFRMTVPADGIHEGRPDLYRVTGLEVLPGFGAARTGESGYLVLPNWCGCQTFFDKDYPREVRQTIYSSNDQWEQVCNMPVFGIVREHGTLCGLVARGDADAQLVCRVHWGADQANSIHPTLVYRWEQQDALIPGEREVRYRFAPPAWRGGEGYVFCGREYRRFLRGERGLLTWDEKRTQRPAAVDYGERFFLKIFLANKKPQDDGRGEYRCCCTFDEARTILEDCQKRGMHKLTATLVGWGQDGHDGMYPTRFPVDERLGGEEGLRALNAWCGERDILLAVHDSYGASYSCSPEHDLNEVIRHRSGEPWRSIVWSGGRVHVQCPAVYVDKYVRRDIPAIRRLGLHGHLHIDAVGSFMTCYAPAHPVEQRADYIDLVRQMFQVAIDELGSVSTEMPFGPYFDVVDGFFHTYADPYAWHLASPVGRFFFDRSIPLVPIALHGSANCCQHVGGDGHWLRLADFGLSPQYEVCMRKSPEFGIPAYADSADHMQAAYERFYGPDGLVTRLGGYEIEGRWEPTPTVSDTRYADGTRLVVNRGDEAWEDVAPRSIAVRQ